MDRTTAALIVYERQLLLHLRDNKHPDPNLRNKWGLVGGQIEKGEDPNTAVLREIKEEANLSIKKIEYLGAFNIKYSNKEVEAHLFCSQISYEVAKNLKLGNEGLDVKFFSIDEIMNLDLAPGLKEYYSMFQNDINSYIESGVINKRLYNL